MKFVFSSWIYRKINNIWNWQWNKPEIGSQIACDSDKDCIDLEQFPLSPFLLTYNSIRI